MQIEIIRVEERHRPVLARLAQFYQYDFSEIEGNGFVNEDGLYPYVNLEPYWTEKDRHPFLVRVDGSWAGFVLVSRHSYSSNAANIMEISEFFIMRVFRHKGVGDEVAQRVFDMFPGKWELQVTAANTPALHFWRRVVGEYTGGHYEEVFVTDWWHGPVMSFVSRVVC